MAGTLWVISFNNANKNLEPDEMRDNSRKDSCIQTCYYIVHHNSPAVLHFLKILSRLKLDNVKKPEQEETGEPEDNFCRRISVRIESFEFNEHSKHNDCCHEREPQADNLIDDNFRRVITVSGLHNFRRDYTGQEKNN